MKQIINKKVNFFEFYKELTTFLNKEGALENVLINNCIVTNIPKNYKILLYSKSIKIFGIPMYTTDGTFCGFPCKEVTITNNIFEVEDYETKT